MAPKKRATPKKTAATPTAKVAAKSTTPEPAVQSQPTLRELPRPVAVSIKQRGDNWCAEETVEYVPGIEVRKRTTPARANSAKKAVKPLSPAPDSRIRKRSSLVSSISDSVKQRINSWAARNKGYPPTISSSKVAAPVSATPIRSPEYVASLKYYPTSPPPVRAPSDYSEFFARMKDLETESKHLEPKPEHLELKPEHLEPKPNLAYQSVRGRFARAKAHRDETRELASLYGLEKLWKNGGIDTQKWKLFQRRRMGPKLYEATAEVTLIAARTRFYKCLQDGKVDMSLLGPFSADRDASSFVPATSRKHRSRSSISESSPSPTILAAARKAARQTTRINEAWERSKGRDQSNTVKGEALMQALRATRFSKTAAQILEERNRAALAEPKTSEKPIVYEHAKAASEEPMFTSLEKYLLPAGIVLFPVCGLAARSLGLM